MSGLSYMFVLCVALAVNMAYGATSSTTSTSSTTPNSQNSTTAAKVEHQNATTAAKFETKPPMGCSFVLKDHMVRDRLSDVLEAGSKLIKFHIKFDGYEADVLNKGAHSNGYVFRPFLWMRSTTTQGQSLLMLDDHFEVLSLSLLGIGVHRMDVELLDRPWGCMNGLTSEARVNKTRHLLLNDFKVPGPGEKSGSLDKKERICNTRIRRVGDIASFVHHCCHVHIDGMETCEDVERHIWIHVLMVCIILIKILVVLYSPSFLPQSFYMKKFTDAEYIYKIPDDKKGMRLRIVKTMYPGSYTSENPPVRLEELDGLEYLKLSLDRMEMDNIYDFNLRTIHLSVKARKLLPENYVPVSILKMIYENVFRCKMRSIPVLKPCCNTGIFGTLGLGFKIITWYKCLRIVAKLILIALLTIPWIIRLWIYFSYEAVTAEEKRAVAEKMGINVSFNGSFTLYLTPLHGMFIVIYLIVIVDSFAYGLLGRKMKNRFKFILRKCLRDMRERSRLSAYSWVCGLCILPFKRFGLIGFILAPFYWALLLIVILPVLAFYTFPAINLSIRLVIHMFIFMCPRTIVDRFHMFTERMSNVKSTLKMQDIGDEDFQGKGNMSKKEVFLQLCIIIMCLTSFWSMTFLLMECLSFFVEVGVYTLMGIIVNAGATLQYITVIFLIYMYAKSSFGKVNRMYLDYHKIIRGLLLDKKKEDIKRTARQEENVQDNTAFRVMSPFNITDKTSGICLEVKDGLLRWKTQGLMVFLDKKDQPFTPEKFFFETINMNYCGCPGQLWRNTLNASFEFMKVMVFLFFVVIVVLAFGNQFSTTNQMLATLAGGFVPFVFRHFFQKGSGSFTVDTESIQFVTEFDKTIAAYAQKWATADIFPTSIKESGLVIEDNPESEENEKEANPENNNSNNNNIGSNINNTATDEVGDTSTSPLIEPSTNSPDAVGIKIYDSDDEGSESDSAKVDLIIDIARFDKKHRRLGMEGTLVNVGSLSLLGDGTTPVYRPAGVVHV